MLLISVISLLCEKRSRVSQWDCVFCPREKVDPMHALRFHTLNEGEKLVARRADWSNSIHWCHTVLQQVNDYQESVGGQRYAGFSFEKLNSDDFDVNVVLDHQF